MLSFFQHLFPYYVFRVHLAIVSARFERKKPPLKSILPVFGVAHAVWHAARGMYAILEENVLSSKADEQI